MTEPAAKQRYRLAILTIILAFNGLDRTFLSLAVQDIKTEMALSDTQVGLLTGVAFAIFYSLMGIPIARLADRLNRVSIIAATTALWSVGVALCGLAGNYAQLMLIRVGVAVGEAGCVPPAHSLIADYFDRAERPRAVARYMLGYPLSVILGYFAAGWINELVGWRMTFVILGTVGVPLALWAWFALEEPRRRKGAVEEPGAAAPPLRAVLHALWSNISFRHLLLAVAVTSLFSYGFAQWLPAFFIRSYGFGTGELGTWLALVWGGGGLLGTFIGGDLASRYLPNNETMQLRLVAIANILFGVLMVVVFVATSAPVSFALLGLALIGGAAVNGPLFATIQTLVPDHMRAISISLIYLFANLIGLGLGPLIAGVLSDALQPTFGTESLRYALLCLCPGWLWGAWHVWRASKTVAVDIGKNAPTDVATPARISVCD